MSLKQALERCPTELLIDGAWVPASDGRRISVVDPATTEVFANVASATPEDAVAAVDAASRALPGWADTPPRVRSAVLRRAYELMIERREEFAALISAENGKALADARAEVNYAAEFFRWFSEEAVRLAGTIQTAPSGGYRIVVDRVPIGVAVLITPWNYPAAMATRKIGPALAAGCSVVLKPASDTPLTALAVGALMLEAGAPPGVVNVVPADRSSKVVTALLDQPAVRKLSFTGSTEVGRVLLRQAAERVISSSMELGGNAPFLVLADADLDAAVEGAMIAKMRNGGEACTAANRFYVHESVAEEFSRKFAEAMQAVRMGPGLEESTELGPLVNESARGKVDELVQDAVDRGAVIRTGGKAPDRTGYYYEPTVLDRVDAGSVILAEEIFGPVAPIVRFSDVDDAIRMANDTPYGLVSYLYTTDLREGMRVAGKLEAGMVGLNRGLVSDPAAPFGGVKESGLGREGGHEGMLEYTETKYIATDW
ncbi:NAD-dependent succinate-semialdehyde dehydrogenase [Sinosporangium siamense]|uniref:NAD-dependent succinate-semialdehyde dehydrogenase n=1 Tax=Sinosporangium siamense TaxID=1367973 RepID=A0A919RF88_9ACTN|nr:NAD-dependent succinate-semialdehyde dehydrogenase [Sinosporangium siamense]GII92811.1 NAD-dependent succinate-semialdehyde dehydrogenase [Sinosporangium siamense]